MTQPWPKCGGLTEPHTWASEQTHHPWGAEQFWQTGSKWTGAVKSLLPRAGNHPSDVGGCLTSPAWLLVSLSTPQTQAIFFSNTSVKKKKKKNHWCPLIQTVIMRYTISIDFVMSLFMPQVVRRRTQFARSFHVDQTVSHFLLECLSNSTFFYPLLMECHSCSANTEPWVCLRAYSSPSARTIALFRLAHTLTACTVQAKKHGNIQCRCAGAREAVCCTIWPSFLIGMLHVQSSDVQNKYGVRKAS